MMDSKKALQDLCDELGICFAKNTKTNAYMIYLNDVEELNPFDSDKAENIINCLNAEPDSMAKIKAEFKELGYDVTEFKNCIEIQKWNKEEYTGNVIDISKSGKIVVSVEEDYLPLKVLQLINRIYRLWGVEV